MNLASLKIIGMIHFPPLLGCEWYPGINYILQKTEKDILTLEAGWVNAIIIENNYDIPHVKYLEPQTTAQMTYLAIKTREITKLPLGICCLWNDWKSALSIANIAWLQFVRIPVFVDHIKTSYGFEIQENPSEIQAYRKKIEAEHIKIIVDIHVKHSTILNNDTLDESAYHAVDAGADGLIVTGKWTGDAPDMSNLSLVRNTLGEHIPIFAGSGVDPTNIKNTLQIANGAIIGTYFKTKKHTEHSINVRSFEEEIDREKVLSVTSLV